MHRDISFTIKKGEVVTLLGPSGTGKTVVLKLIIRLLTQDSGSITVLGQDVASADQDQLLQLRRRVGMLFQGAALFDSLSVYDNIAYPLHETRKYTAAEIEEIVYDKLGIVALERMVHKYPPELSGGQKKRIALARALASSPEIILFDEPTTGLDPTAIRKIDDAMIRLNREYEMTTVVVTHDIESARRVSERWLLFNAGHVIADGPVQELEQSNKDVQRFISGQWS